MERQKNLVMLNELLFDELYRLCDEGLEGDALAAEIERSKAVSNVAGGVIANVKLALDASRQAEDGALASTTSNVCNRLLGGSR